MTFPSLNFARWARRWPRRSTRLAVDLSQAGPGFAQTEVGYHVVHALEGLRRVPGVRYDLTAFGPGALREDMAPLVDAFLIAGTLTDTQLRSSADCLYCPLGASSFLGKGVPAVSLVADLLHRDHPEFFTQDDIEARDDGIREVVAHSEVIHCLSDFVAGSLRQHFPVAEGRVVVTEPATGIAATAGRQAPAPSSFLYPTGFEPYKNHETLVVAYRIYRKTATYGPLGMVLAGAGNAYSEHLREIARVLGIAEWVTFADAIPPGCLRHSCKPGVCLVWPSLYEGFSVPLMEAVSMGIPIIAGSHTAIPEIVGQGAVFTEVRNPLELAAAMGRAVGDGSLGNRMGGNTHSLVASRPEDSAAETLHGALLRAIRLATVGHEDRI